ncbi:MAG: enoyl-CoA hydratase-related protein, partial [Haliea sp.]
VKLGKAPATIAPNVVRTIGETAARRMFMSGELIAAERAYQLGFLSHLVDEEALDAAIDELTQSLLLNSPEGVRRAKLIATEVAQGDVDDEMIEHTVRFVADIRESKDGREGLNAFLEKRKPAWAEKAT